MMPKRTVCQKLGPAQLGRTILPNAHTGMVRMSEIHQLHAAFTRRVLHKDVLQLDVAMVETALVQKLQPLRNLAHEVLDGLQGEQAVAFRLLDVRTMRPGPAPQVAAAGAEGEIVDRGSGLVAGLEDEWAERVGSVCRGDLRPIGPKQFGDKVMVVRVLPVL
ncbi:hypothetical protein BC830DRAFT_1142515 [Chytriomyces sp. MP71]|nr:hypothetical protein BC830DRAFT_1142515 [Chytriomyces sp. MP71]